VRPRLSASKYFNRLGKEANDFLHTIFEDRLAYRIPQLAVFDALPPRVAEHQLALEWCHRIDAGKVRIEERLGTVIRQNSATCIQPSLGISDHRGWPNNSDRNTAQRRTWLAHQAIRTVEREPGFRIHVPVLSTKGK